MDTAMLVVATVFTTVNLISAVVAIMALVKNINTKPALQTAQGLDESWLQVNKHIIHHN